MNKNSAKNIYICDKTSFRVMVSTLSQGVTKNLMEHYGTPENFGV